MIRVSSPVFVLLLIALQVVAGVRANSGHNRVRRMTVPPRLLWENVDYEQKSIAKMHSDFDNGAGNVVYTLKGIGANQFPFHVFVVNAHTGFIYLTKVLDREDIGQYNLTGGATFLNGSRAEEDLVIRFKIVDENDNPPVFPVIEPGEVDELSPAGTSVMKVTATDADEPGNENSQIAYTLIDQKPPDDMFSMNSHGTIFVKKPLLDREIEDKYILTVRGQDLNGKPGGNNGTATVTINVRDVNDNPPTLEKDEYEGSIEENVKGVEVMKIKAEDLDLEGTDNWEAVFDIVKGNEARYFSITTDPDTNEGILMLDKPVDYEDVQYLELGLTVRNKAPQYDESGLDPETDEWGPCGEKLTGRSGGSTSQSRTRFKTYPIKINVKNQPEGPRFDPKVKAIPVSEGGQSITLGDVIASYPAIDGDTGKPAENVRYVMGSDPDNWLSIDPETAEIRLNKMPDRQSPELVNGKYIGKILCITEDMPAKTATGTVAIQVEDYNDNCPRLTTEFQTICLPGDAVIVNAIDEDAQPNGPPFEFVIVPEGTEGKWKVQHLNDTTAILRAQRSLWPGFYMVEVVVTDQQGHACPEPQKVKVHVCTCEDGKVCGEQRGGRAELGPAGIGLLLLGLLLLLLIPLLLLSCQCGGTAGYADLYTGM